MFDFIMKGGILMYPILVCSVIALAIIMERLYQFHRVRIDINTFSKRLKDFLVQGNLPGARTLACEYRGPVARVIHLLLDDSYPGRLKKEEAISRIGSQEIRKLERNLRGLSIISNIAPLLGLLGTVIGMIRAFIRIEELGGRVDVQVLAGGIWEAMITTGAGLVVAIPAMVAYHLFEGKVDEIAACMKDTVSEIGALLGVKEIDSFVEEEKMAALKEEEGYGI